MALIQVSHPGPYQIITEGNIGPNSLANSVAVNQTPNRFTADLGYNSYVNVTGTGFRYDGQGHPTDGVVTAAEVFGNGVSFYTVTGIAVKISDLYQWANTFADSSNPPASPVLIGNDTINGGASRDFFQGGPGHDYLFGGDGADEFNGGDGNDHIYGQSPNGGPDGDDGLNGGGGNDYIQGNAGNDRIGGGDGSDRIQGGQGDDGITGGDGNDTVNGNLGNDRIVGNAGDDLLRGGQGNDRIVGNTGNDILIGDKGDDTLFGGAGLDVMTGGEGRDAFYLRGGTLSGAGGLSAEISAHFTKSGPLAYQIDEVTDFRIGEDVLGLGSAYSTKILYDPNGAINIAEAVDNAEHLLSEYIGSFNESNPGVALYAVGTDTYLFMRSHSDIINIAIKLTNVSAADLARSNSSFVGSFEYNFDT